MSLRSALWGAIAFIASREPVANWIIARAQATPYFHLDGYMDRWWFFNGYPADPGDKSDAERQAAKPFPRLPSIRVHHILRDDLAQHLHDHPWNARTMILRGWYIERREQGPARVLRRGDTAAINFGEYHSIDAVSDGGVWTMFIVGRYGGKWGFNVDGTKVAPRDYVDAYPERK